MYLTNSPYPHPGVAGSARRVRGAGTVCIMTTQDVLNELLKKDQISGYFLLTAPQMARKQGQPADSGLQLEGRPSRRTFTPSLVSTWCCPNTESDRQMASRSTWHDDHLLTHLTAAPQGRHCGSAPSTPVPRGHLDVGTHSAQS